MELPLGVEFITLKDGNGSDPYHDCSVGNAVNGRPSAFDLSSVASGIASWWKIAFQNQATGSTRENMK
jgi:hypothetical protein